MRRGFILRGCSDFFESGLDAETLLALAHFSSILSQPKPHSLQSYHLGLL